MKEAEINMYCNVMEEVKRRTSVLDFFLTGKGHALYKATLIESICLQLRKILELIAMSSLIANNDEYSKVYADFAKSWNAEYLVKDLERVNPEFYPKPIIEVSCNNKSKPTEWKDREGDCLTKDEFIKLYKKCGAIMHADNPYGSKIDYGFYEKQIPIWRQRIISLLNSHTIRLLNDENLYLIHMKEDRDDRVHHYVFAPVK